MGKLFRNDYSEIAHKKVLDAVIKASSEQNIGYGLDKHSANAADLIKNVFECPNSDVHFLVGGTQTNMTVISYILRDYECVIACDTGHINVHETGAIESKGHKVVTCENVNGKITIDAIQKLINYHCDEHMVKPAMVYISNATELGTVYTKQELTDLYRYCQKNGLYLYIDGARLASALASKDNNLKPNEFSQLCDVFYIGGTKNGLLFGEAVVINNDKLKENFRYQIKNNGAMLAKGFISGVQFETLFTDNLYFEIGKSENVMAEVLSDGLKNLGYEVLPSSTNQIFVVFDNEKADKIINEFACELWEKMGDKSMVRFVTSFATTIDNVNYCLDFIKKL